MADTPPAIKKIPWIPNMINTGAKKIGVTNSPTKTDVPR